LFGSIGIPELMIILVVALVVIGPKRLPDLAKTLGKSLRDFKRATSDFQDTLNLETDYDLEPTAPEKDAPAAGAVKEEKDPNRIDPSKPSDKPAESSESASTTAPPSTGSGSSSGEPPKERTEQT
jgi:sec-independent protein translocase protein TatB